MNNTDFSSAYSLSDRDIKSALLPGTPIVKYADLKHVRHVNQLLNNRGRYCVILYGIRSDTDGHWTGLLWTKGNDGRPSIEVFDPYGMRVDHEFRFPVHHQYERYLSQLLLKSGYPITYNELPFQTKAKDINTCGRHVISRLYRSHLPLYIYWEWLDNQKWMWDTLDDVVTRLI
jgi:hypothetical protein